IFFIAGLSKGSLILRYLWKTKFRGKLTLCFLLFLPFLPTTTWRGSDGQITLANLPFYSSTCHIHYIDSAKTIRPSDHQTIRPVA
ncbi:hypothetical protein, partial [Collimonas sp.]|uniref:hypothetical protein n=1 Tax=Collimonas sp. TaxID=1963772 RepID=UPI0037BF6085